MARNGDQRTNQCDRILKYMQRHGKITPLDALREIGCMRLASRISDLKKKGYMIKSDMVSVKNTAGEKVHFAEYRLEEADELERY